MHLPNPAFGESNPLKAIHSVPIEGWVQIITVISLVELASFNRTYTSGADLGFDPLGMGANDNTMKLREVKVWEYCASCCSFLCTLFSKF